MSRDDKWGVGSAADSQAIGKATVGDLSVELIWGEHPHSRNDNKMYARFPDGSIEAFSGHRVQVRVEVETSNYMKTSYLSGDEVRRACVARIFFDGRQVYEIGGRDPERLLRQAADTLERLREHAMWPFDDETLRRFEGRPVFYERTPAFVRRLLLDQGAVLLEVAPGHKFPPPVWKEPADPSDENSTSVKDDIFSPRIWWFRSGDEAEVLR